MTKFDSIVKAIEATKGTPRTGWLLKGVPPAIAETIASHTYEAAIYSLLLSLGLKKHHVSIDPYKAVTLTLLHDVAEAFIGDIVKLVSDNKLKGAKERLEVEVVREYLGIEEVNKLIEEYYERKTLEAKVAKLADLLATCIQAKRYMKLGYNVNDTYSRVKEGLKKCMTEDKIIRSLKSLIEELTETS